MSALDAAVNVVFAAASDVSPERSEPSSVHLKRLGLHVQVKEVQAQETPGGSLYIAEVIVSVDQRGSGIAITCVGLAESLPSAAESAVGQWVAGVLPVLTAWRGEHTCFVSREPFESAGPRFDALPGPLIARNLEGEGTESGGPPPSLYEAVKPSLASMRLLSRVHWIELYTGKSPDGSINATCRLNNRDWMPGQRVLEQVAQPWAPVPLGLRTCRQFALLVPPGAKDGALPQITLWQRLRNAA